MFSRSELEAAWETVLDHDRRTEIPDVIGWRDLHIAALRGDAVAPLPATTYLVPRKQPGSLRRIDVLDPAAHAEYVAAVARVAPVIERSLGPGVTAHRLLRSGPGQWLERWGRARSRHRALLRRLLANEPLAVAMADVRDCFARIRANTIEQALCGLGGSRSQVAALNAAMRSTRDVSSGLPVGPEPSGVLANAVLALADRAVAAEGGRHIRWVDDFAIATRSTAAASRVLDRLRAALAELGLEPAAEKCRIVEAEYAARIADGEAARSGRSRLHASPVMHEGIFAELEAGRASLPDPAVADRIRAVARRRWGSAEAGLLASLADDPGTSTPVRAWAWRALARSDPAGCIDRAAGLTDDGDPWVRRAIVAATGLAGGARARRVLRALRGRMPQVAPTSAWGLDMTGAGT